MTIDVEEYFHVSALEPHIPRRCWPSMESRIDHGMGRILDLLSESGTRATFFVLGCMARDHPDLVRRIAGSGHEVASHGWDHRRVTELSPDGFRAQVRDSRALLQDLSAQPVLGYRAPSFSIVPGGEWALEILVEEGYRYDSSLYPVRRRGYGYPGGERGISILRLEGGDLVELPPATLRFGGRNLPVGGGGSFRQFPYGVTSAALRAFERDGNPATFYLHPWELDPEQPRVPGISWLTRVRHYRGLDRTEDRMRRLLREFRFQPVAQTLAAMDAARNGR